MRYTKFTIKNYKGIPEITLDLKQKPQTRIFTLVGLNESGKTSILEAINLFEEGISKQNAHTLIPKSRKYSFSDSISVEAELELSEEDLEYIKDYLQSHYNFYLSDFEKGKILLSRDIYKYLQDWLKGHIMGMDMKYEDFFKDKEVSE